jgi:hypothetical protein
LVFAAIGAGILIAYVSDKLKKEYSIVLLAFFILIDLWSADKRYLGSDRFERQSAIQKTFTPSVADAAILQDKSYHRVLNLSVSTFNDNSPTSWFHKSVGGYHGAKLERYQELIDSSLFRELMIFSDAFDKKPSTVEELLPVFTKTTSLNMLNTKYVIYNSEAPPLVNPNAMGNAWFVQTAVMAGNANEELALLKTIDISREAAIDVKFSDLVRSTAFDVDSADKIELVSYQPNELEYKYTAGGERLAVFSEIYYPAGWLCYIDGNESSYFRANYVLRGMILPSGSHSVKFTFKPSSYYNGNKVSLASSLILILLTAGYFGASFFRKIKQE